MKVKQFIKGAVSAVMVLAAVALVGGSTASALPVKTNKTSKATLNLVHEQFAATGFATSFVNTITNPPMIGQGFILEENLVNSSNVVIGTDHIDCRIVAFTTTSLQFACTAQFSFTNGGTLSAVTSFNTTQVNYDAYVLSGTGAYSHAVGVIHVTDHGPGNPTGYVFDFYHL